MPMEYINRRKFLNRTGAALAIGAVSAQPAAAISGGGTGQQTVGTLGPAGSYSHRAAFQTSDDIEFYDTMFEVAAAVTNEDIDAGVLPIENSIQGAVIDTLDILIEEDLFITAEVTEEIRHALIAQSADFEVIASHPQALSQSSSFLEEEYPDVEQQEVDSTSAGVEMAAEDESNAAIAHPDLADDFDLETIATDIQNVENNVTRFLKFERSRAEDGGSKSTVLVYPGSDTPGFPAEVLHVLAAMNLDLTRLEARPSATELGDYIYHLDFEHERTDQIVCRLELVTEWTRYLGSYDLIAE